MISESWPWKRDLARRVEALRRREAQRRWPEASLAAVERDIFIAAYELRKLLDAGKISDEVEALRLQALAYPPTERAADIMNWDKIDELYDLSSPARVDVSLRDFCNQIIHSFVFVLSFAEPGGLAGFLVASERDRGRRLLDFRIDEVTEALLSAVHDDIVTMRVVREAIGAPARIVKKSSRTELFG